MDRTQYRLTLHGSAWILQATPERKHPWLLAGADGVKQEIGPADVKAAQAMSEFWLDVGAMCAAVEPDTSSYTDLRNTATDPPALVIRNWTQA